VRVFVTGASGFLGSAVVPELIGAGHQVVGLARSDASAEAVAAAGAQVRRGGLDDPDGLRAGAADCDGAIHLAFVHDFSDYAGAARTDVVAIEALGAAYEGTGRPLVIASGTLGLAPGRTGTERDLPDGSAGPRAAGLRAALALAGRGVRPSVVRLAPSVHDERKRGFVGALVDIAREKGVSGHVGDGSQRWPAVHRLDAARLFRLALEDAPAGTVLHGVADEGVPIRTIAEVIGRHLDLPVVSVPPEEAGGHFGWMAPFLAIDSPASNALTRERFGWRPTHPGLLDDLDRFFDTPAEVG
jgi:nucleoside-diphosphate-sugar epimerase